MADTDNLCEKCEEKEIEVNCSCGAGFCDGCFSMKHLRRHRTHRKAGNRKDEEKWKLFTGTFSGIKSLVDQFKEDEDAKWFGLHTDRDVNGVDYVSIVETERLKNTMSESLIYYDESPRRQFPSIASFVGETGAGKSTLVRSMIYNSEKAKDFNPLEAPVAGQNSDSSTKSTTGEVNLYPDPATFGTEFPVFYVDCEGIMGSSDPLSAGHQKKWTKDASARRYSITVKGNRGMDRRTAVQTLYPRFLYIFSDVVCYVTGNQRTWAESAIRLLKWSLAGAQSSINQHSLPALIIALNAPRVDRPDWISDPDAATKAFFETIAGEITKDNFVKKLANRYGSQNMVELFYRSYSSVYVHYIPIKGYESCGATGTVVDQTVKLSHRIRSDAERVQSARAGAWMRFDTKQLSVLISSAFKHLASGRDEPFDFSQCRERLSIPNSTEEHFSRILGHCLRGKMEEKFEKMGMVMASSLLRHAIHEEKSDTAAPLTPASVFNKEIRALCDRAVSKFLDDNAQCAYVNPSNGRRCVNTKSGHAQGHQDQTGACLSLGFFISSSFDSQSFLAIVEKSIGELMNKIDSAPSLSRLDWQRRAAEAHRENLKKLRELNGFPWKKSSYTQNDFGRDASVCYACFFGRPEYRLPCGHAICVTCLEDFDSDQIMDKKLYPGVFTHSRCIICDATGAAWPYRTHVKPRLAGVRVLSLDGGGVRGVVELVVLRELEKKTGLGIPLGRFFDFIIGTSAGGIISLGIGIQDRTADDCLSRFHEFTRAGFTKKWLNKTRLFRPVGRLLRSSIYSTPELEGALQNAFRPSPAQDVFGLRNPCRVAVTTTANRGLMLIANYNRGNDKRYLHSDDLAIWKAARCTSAAPMFFERAHHAGNECWDGGLKANNPIHHAVAEAKTIWGEDVDFDLLLSIGSGRASVPVKQSTSSFGQPSGWLSSLFKTMLANMDGEITWEGFSPEPRIRDRAVRLNVELTGSRQPSLDDVGTVFEMQSAAQRYAPHNGHENPFRKSPLSPLAGDVSSDMLLCLAGRLRASMFFFEMNSMDIKKGAASFGGSICCRLTPEEKGFTALMNCTQYFTTAGRQYELPKSAKPVAGSARAPFEIPITFCWDPESKDPIRIDVHFGDGKEPHPSRFSISGFPMMVTSLLEYGKMHCDSYVKVGPSRGAAGHSRAKSEKASRISVADRNVTSLDEGVAFEDEKIAALPRYSDVVGNSEMEGY